MPPSIPILRHALASGSVAGLLSAAMLAWRGRREAASAVAPINAVSHWLHGHEAFAADRPSLRYTALGLTTHWASAVLWGVLYEAVLGRIARPQRRDVALARAPAALPAPRPARPSSAGLFAGAALVTAVAALVDFKMVPARLTPGFEHRLRPSSLVLVYLAFGTGLALGAACRGPDRSGRPTD